MCWKRNVQFGARVMHNFMFSSLGSFNTTIWSICETNIRYSCEKKIQFYFSVLETNVLFYGKRLQSKRNLHLLYTCVECTVTVLRCTVCIPLHVPIVYRTNSNIEMNVWLWPLAYRPSKRTLHTYHHKI